MFFLTFLVIFLIKSAFLSSGGGFQKRRYGVVADTPGGRKCFSLHLLIAVFQKSKGPGGSSPGGRAGKIKGLSKIRITPFVALTKRRLTLIDG